MGVGLRRFPIFRAILPSFRSDGKFVVTRKGDRPGTGSRETATFIGILEERGTLTIDHDSAVSEVRKLLANPNFGIKWTSDSWLRGVISCQSVGLFSISLEFHRRGLTRFEKEVENFWGLRKSLGLAQVAIHTGNLRLGSQCLSQLSRSVLGKNIGSVQAVSKYLTTWVGDIGGGNSGFVDKANSDFSDLVRGKNIYLYGPAEGPEVSGPSDSDSVAVGMLRATGKLGFSSGIPCLGGSTLVYANHETEVYFGRLEDNELKELLGEFSAVVFKSTIPSDLQRHTDTLIRMSDPDWRSLFLYGHPNMAPLIVNDLLSFSPSTLFVSGVDFYLGMYQKDLKRYDYENGILTTQSGAGGKHFEMCASIGQHSPIENRNIIRNLYNSNRIGGNERFEQSLMLSDEAYLEALEEKFGRGAL